MVDTPPSALHDGSPPGSATPLSRRTLLGAIGAGVLGIAGCTGSSGSDAGPAGFRLHLPQGQTIIADGSPATVSTGVSKALLQSAPAVVLAAVGDAASAWKPALSLGIPLLLVDDDPDRQGGQTTPADAGTAEEITRLGASDVLVIGTGAQAFADTLQGVSLHDAERQLPEPDRPVVANGSVLLTLSPVPDADATEVDPGTVAAAATARATGVPVVTTPGGDPRDNAACVEALAKLKPTRVLAVGSAFGTPDLLAGRLSVAATGTQLPGGGQRIGGKLYVALYGHPGTPVLGILGEQNVEGAVEVAKTYADPYRPLTPQPVVPTFEIISTVATSGAGPDGDFANEWDPNLIRPWIERAGREGIYVMLDLQPGLDRLLEQAKRYEELWRYPHVGVALDPEWKLLPGQRPLSQIGQVDVEEINEVADWLSGLVRAARLPQKAFVLHQFQLRMILRRENLRFYDELQTIVHVDGHGAPKDKLRTYAVLTANAQPQILWGWKNFIDEDAPMFTPEQTMAVVPTPTMVSYQ